ncbi:MAG: helicase-related protein [Merdibacter sp.]
MAAQAAEAMRAEGLWRGGAARWNLNARSGHEGAERNCSSQSKSYVVATDIAARGIDIEGITHVISLGSRKSWISTSTAAEYR